ncbi:MAG: PIN domain-containing protein [Betaproteobacteria bacterium]|nr:MAG: PIN domain-containing protein [Betaproteobacteria bacterium]
MVYVDTSALVPAFIREPKSAAILAWIESSGERLAISEWSVTEFASAAAIKVRTGQVTAPLAKRAWTRFLDFAEKHCLIAVPNRAEFRRAADLAGDPSRNLRAGDAIHLAIAEALQAKGVLTFDGGMSESVKALGLNAVTI